MQVSARTVWIAATALAAASVAAAGARHHYATANEQRSAAPSTGDSRGLERRWALRLEVGLQSADGKSENTEVTGDWVERPGAPSAGGYDVACAIEAPRVAGTAPAGVDSKDVAALERRLSGRIVVTYQADGAAIRIRYPRDMDNQTRNLLQLVATAKQLVRPKEASDTWIATERDAAGSYVAQYHSPGPLAVVKHKLRYLAVDGIPDKTGLRVAVDDSETLFTLDDEGRPGAIDARESNRIDMQLGTPGLGVTVRLHLDHPRTDRAPVLPVDVREAEARTVSEPIVTQRTTDDELQAHADAAVIAGVSIEELLAALASGRDEPKMRTKLEAMFRRRPETVMPAVRFALGGTTQAQSAVLDALGVAGTAQTQQALCDLSDDPRAPLWTQKAALIALVGTRRPDESTMGEFLRRTERAEGVADASARHQLLFTAGTLARNGQDAHPEAAAGLISALARRYAHCGGDETECVAAIGALGNAGTPAVMPFLQPILSSPDATRRAAAADALRLVRDPEADRWIVDRIADDPDPGVRAAAVATARYRPIEPLFGVLSQALESDPADRVRIQAVDVLTAYVGNPLVQQAFVAAAAHDSSANVRRLAREGLQPTARGRLP